MNPCINNLGSFNKRTSTNQSTDGYGLLLKGSAFSLLILCPTYKHILIMAITALVQAVFL